MTFFPGLDQVQARSSQPSGCSGLACPLSCGQLLCTRGTVLSEISAGRMAAASQDPLGMLTDFPAPGKHSVLGLKQAFFVGDSRRLTQERGFNVRARLAYRPSPDGCLKGIPFSDPADLLPPEPLGSCEQLEIDGSTGLDWLHSTYQGHILFQQVTNAFRACSGRGLEGIDPEKHHLCDLPTSKFLPIA